MWPHFTHLFFRSLHAFLSAQGTTALGFVSPAVISLLSGGIVSGVILYSGGWQAMKEHWKKDAVIVLLAVVVANLACYGTLLGRTVVNTVYQDHQDLVSENIRLRNAKPVEKTIVQTKEVRVGGSSVQEVPKSQLDVLLEINKRLSAGDRSRFTDALHDFTQVLDQANTLWGKANRVDDLGSSTDFETRKTRLQDVESSAKDYERAFSQSRQTWHYYAAQVGYIFGDNPDNDALIIRNAAVDYFYFLDALGKLPTTNNGAITLLLADEQNVYGSAIARFIGSRIAISA